MAHTDLPSVLAQEIESKIRAVAGKLGIQDVFYGNHTQIPHSPAVVVLAASKRRSLAGVSSPGGRTMNELVVFIDVHNSTVGDEAGERLSVETLASNIEAELHKDTTMGGLIIHGFVTEWNNGETTISSGEFRTVRMTYVGTTKTYLSPSP